MSDSSIIRFNTGSDNNYFTCTYCGRSFFRKELDHRHRNILSKRITSREKEVLQLLSNGYSSKIIAQKLHISETTAITHRKNLIEKFQVRNTPHLIKMAFLFRII